MAIEETPRSVGAWEQPLSPPTLTHPRLPGSGTSDPTRPELPRAAACAAAIPATATRQRPTHATRAVILAPWSPRTPSVATPPHPSIRTVGRCFQPGRD